MRAVSKLPSAADAQTLVNSMISEFDGRNGAVSADANPAQDTSADSARVRRSRREIKNFIFVTEQVSGRLGLFDSLLIDQPDLLDLERVLCVAF